MFQFFVHSVVALNKSHIVRGVHCFPLGFAAQRRDILGKMAKNYMKIAKSTFWGEIVRKSIGKSY